MREFNALVGYPEPAVPRYVGPHVRTIHNRIIASYRGREFYDGDRNHGYGGFTYDGRWVPIAKFMAKEYGLTAASAVLQINCEKGFFLHDLQQLLPGITVRGVEISDYAIDTAMPSVRPYIQKAPFTQLPFADQAFDFVIAIGAVYALTLTDAIACLKEIQRVSKDRSFITLASYETEQDKRLFEWWTLLGTTILRQEEWLEVLRHAGYTGDYKLTSAKTLKLVEAVGRNEIHPPTRQGGGIHGVAPAARSLEAGSRLGSFIREQVRQLAAGGVPVFWRKLRAAVLLGPAVLLMLVARLARPIVTVRIGRLKSLRIGHFAINTELYLCKRDLDRQARRTFDVFYHEMPISNTQLQRMWDRTLRTAHWAQWLDRANRLLPGSAAHTVPMATDRDIHGLLARSRTHVAFTAEEEQRGREALRRFGVPEGAPFFCFHARDAAYLNAVFPDRTWDYHDYRDSSIHRYVPAAEELARRGYTGFRLGAIVKEPIATTHPRVIDYATTARTDFLDIFLGARCRFALGSSGGVCTIPMLFRRPIAYVNFVSLEYVTAWNEGGLFIPKLLWIRSEQRLMTFREMLTSGAGRFVYTAQYQAAGVEVVENTAEEITALALEMHERLEGAWQPDPDDEALQRRFWSLWKPSELNRTFRVRLGAAFLREHRSLLE